MAANTEIHEHEPDLTQLRRDIAGLKGAGGRPLSGGGGLGSLFAPLRDGALRMAGRAKKGGASTAALSKRAASAGVGAASDLGKASADSVGRAVSGAKGAVTSISTPTPRRRPPSRANQREWIAMLEDMGAPMVQEELDRSTVSAPDKDSLVTFIDAGVTRGAFRFPTRDFVENWLMGDAEYETETRAWRVVVLILLLFGVGVTAMVGWAVV